MNHSLKVVLLIGALCGTLAGCRFFESEEEASAVDFMQVLQKAQPDLARYLTFPRFPVGARRTALALTMLAFTFLGDGLRDLLDPRMRGRR